MMPAADYVRALGDLAEKLAKLSPPIAALLVSTILFFLAADVVGVAERHRLLLRHAHAGEIRRLEETAGHRARDAEHDDDPRDRDARDRVRAGMEDLRHRLAPAKRPRRDAHLR